MSKRSTCPYCGTGCGVIVETAADQTITISGDTAHPANLGRLCSKGSALAETLSVDNRLLHPEIDGQRCSWNRAIDRVARSLSDTIAQFGYESIAFYVSGQLQLLYFTGSKPVLISRSWAADQLADDWSVKQARVGDCWPADQAQIKPRRARSSAAALVWG